MPELLDELLEEPLEDEEEAPTVAVTSLLVVDPAGFVTTTL